MVSPAPTRFNPELLVRQSERLSVVFPVSHCKRLVALLADDSGEFRAEFALRQADEQAEGTDVLAERHILAVGRMATDVVLVCQRCLQSFSYPIETEFEFRLVTDKVAADAAPENVDPVVLDDDGMIHVVDLFEDELILQLPTVPKHESAEDCEFAVPVVIDGKLNGNGVAGHDSGDETGSNAFAALKNLQIDKE